MARSDTCTVHGLRQGIAWPLTEVTRLEENHVDRSTRRYCSSTSEDTSYHFHGSRGSRHNVHLSNIHPTDHQSRGFRRAVHLPDELLQLIFRYLLNTDRFGRRSLAQSLRTCKQWHGVGVEVLWSNVRLHQWNIYAFCQKPGAANYKYIHNLTLAPESESLKGNTGVQQAGRALQLFFSMFPVLATAIPFMRNLTTFSLSLAELPPAPVPWHGVVHLPTAMLEKVVLALPQSVRNLEIDTNGQNQMHNGEGITCICGNFLSHLPRLQNLRLRLSRICPKVFQPAHHLLSFFIELFRDDRQFTLLCGNRNSSHRQCNPDAERHSNVAAQILVTNLRESISRYADYFPKVTKFNIFELKDLAHDREFSVAIVKHDYVSMKTISYPLIARTRLSCCSPLFVAARTSRDKHWLGNEHVGTQDQVIHEISGEPWITTAQGTRYHKSVLKTSQAIWFNLHKSPIFDISFILGAPSWLLVKDYRELALLLTEESRHKRMILEPAVETFGDTGIPQYLALTMHAGQDDDSDIIMDDDELTIAAPIDPTEDLLGMDSIADAIEAATWEPTVQASNGT